jgi:cysteine desulfurase
MQVYLDNNATTQVDEKVYEKMKPFFCDIYGNPSSLHKFGTKCHNAMNIALEQLYKGINASDDDDIIVNANATEANNNVLKSVWINDILNGSKTNIVISEVEHPSVTAPAEFLKEQGVEIRYARVDDNGELNFDEIVKLIDDDTALVSIMWVNNETGKVFPVAQIGNHCKNKNVLFHTDATQAIGKVDVDVSSFYCNFLSFSAHKFHGPKGVGGLYIKKNTPFTPLLHGGEQMGDLRAGTIDVASMVGMGEAMELATSVKAIRNEYTVVKSLRDKLENALLEIDDTILIGGKQNRTPNTSLISFKGVEGEGMIWDLNNQDVGASTGSACASESLEANPVMNAFGNNSELAHTGIRFSLSRFNDEKQIDYAIKVVQEAVNRLRAISSSYAVN